MTETATAKNARCSSEQKKGDRIIADVLVHIDLVVIKKL
jgi:hypothetical protein